MIERTPTLEGVSHSRSAQVTEIVQLGLMLYTPEGLELFLTTPMGVFDGQTAMQLIERSESDQVLAALAADYEGMGW